MDATLFVNEKTHPIKNAWLIKNIIYTILATILIGALLFLDKSKSGYENVFISIGLIVFNVGSVIQLILRKINFKYNFGEKDIILKQGIIAKSERHTFYGRIQNIAINQDLMDRFLGIASLAVETASDSGGAGFMLSTQGKEKGGSPNFITNFFPGFASSFISIPGLSHENAVTFKEFIMERMKANPIDDSNSGL